MSDVAIAVVSGSGAAALLTAILGYFLNRRATSGRVGTTDADGLWKAVNQQLTERDIFTKGLTDKVTSLTWDLGQLHRELGAKDGLISALQREISEMRSQHIRELGEFRSEMTRKDQRIAMLEADRLALQNRVIDLETRQNSKDLAGATTAPTATVEVIE
jgi:chromosome segregation ATPase